MAITEMSLPAGIPWKRIGVSKDMIDQANDDAQPKRWRSSIAVFYHEPPEIPPEYCGRRITYLKVVCTLTNFSPHLSDEEITALKHLNETESARRFTQYYCDNLKKSLPCYGALVNITVLPNPSQNVAIHDYPYISAFEPRKREMYETVSESGEVLSQSSNNVNVGKQYSDTLDEEAYDLDTGSSYSYGFSDSGSGGFGLAAYEHAQEESESETGQWGTIARKNRQSQEVITKDSSRDKRESFSYSTNINNIYSLLQGYHLGTNRALFFLQPRPHIQNTKFTFIQGPRKLEGIQEFFLIVNRPHNINGLCIKIDLETAHFVKDKFVKPKVVHESYLMSDQCNPDKIVPVTPDDPRYDHELENLVYHWNYLDTLHKNAAIKYMQGEPVREEWRNHAAWNEDDFNKASLFLQLYPQYAYTYATLVVVYEEDEEVQSGDIFILGQRLHSCFKSNLDGDGLVDQELSEASHVSVLDNQEWVLEESKYWPKSVWDQTGTRKNQGLVQNTFNRDINDILYSSSSSPNRYDYQKLRFVETEYMFNEMSGIFNNI
ncbi:MAG: hypothetical protein JSV24_02510, partial [Bacteroidales bacterium]